MQQPIKSILVAMDGSENSYKSLEYLRLMFGPMHALEIQMVYILPGLPPLLTEAPLNDPQLKRQLKTVEGKNRDHGQVIFNQALVRAEKLFLDPTQVISEFIPQQVTTAKDICHLADTRHVDAVLMSRRGRTDLKSFFMGSVTRHVVEYNPVCPVWIAGRKNLSQKVLVALDESERSLKAVEYTGTMLAGTNCQITLFYAMRNLNRYVPADVLEGASELKKLWISTAAQAIRPVMDKASEMLVNAGFEKEQIQEKISNGSRSAANDIMAEATKNQYGTIVVGHRGQRSSTSKLAGGVTSKILNSMGEIALWIV